MAIQLKGVHASEPWNVSGPSCRNSTQSRSDASRRRRGLAPPEPHAPP